MSCLALFRGRQAACWMKLWLRFCDLVSRDHKKKQQQQKRKFEKNERSCRVGMWKHSCTIPGFVFVGAGPCGCEHLFLLVCVFVCVTV